MAGSKSGKGVGIWPKLLLWGVVILAGFIYLRDINEKGAEGEPGEGIDATAPSSAAGSTSKGAIETAPAVPIEPASLSEEAAPVAPSLPNDPKTQRKGGSAPEEQARMNGAGVQEAGRTSVTVSPQASNHSDARKGRKAQQSAVSGSLAPQSPEESLPASPGASVAGNAAAIRHPVAESFEEQRTRVMAEYQALRRERWELVRDYWEYMGAPGRPSMGPHGFYPGYAPGYYRPWQ